MIKTVLFVHGTGVRKGPYEHTAARIRAGLDKIRKDIALEPCLWGDSLGARLALDGVSIPKFAGKAAHPSKDNEVVALWELLSRDALFELRELAASARAGAPIAPGEQERRKRFPAEVKALTAHAAIEALLRGVVLLTYWHEAVAAVAGSKELLAALRAAGRVGSTLRFAVARAIVATMSERLVSDNFPAFNKAFRDTLVDKTVDALGGRDKGLKDWFTDRVTGFALRWATAKAQRKRDVLFNSAYPAAGDILLYQARGQDIRDFIEGKVVACGDDVAIIAHSLGGIACVDLLIFRALPQVKLLVTVGSQAPFLYEIGALSSLVHGKPLPAHFPSTWLNFYDRDDLLSYLAATVFKGRARDYEIKSGQPFPHSHSAYWNETTLWDKLAPHLND